MAAAPSGVAAPPTPRVAIVMPAYQAEALVRTTVPAARAALDAVGGGVLLVVDPGSTDATAATAEALGAEVLRLGRRAGPAEARNAGVERIDADVVLFVDSDCVAHPDVVARVQAEFAADPALVSLTGSYDDRPPARGFFSQYMNLRHHHTHQHARREGAGFWAGCGAVRLSAFRAVSGFDAARYPRPMIEDIELGLRLRDLGRTCLDPELQVTHLKRWTLRSVVVTDIVHRAVPWSQLIFERGGGMPDDLNLRWSQRIAAALAPAALTSLVAAPVLLWRAPAWAPLPAAVLLLSLVLNRDFVRFSVRARGAVFAGLAWAFHQVHLTYSAATLALVAARRAVGRGGAASAA